MNYVDYVYEIVKTESGGMDAIYEDYIIHLVGHSGLNELKEHRLIETCGVVGGRQLYTVCKSERGVNV